jgi:hypothetical protein
MNHTKGFILGWGFFYKNDPLHNVWVLGDFHVIIF